MHCNRSTRIQAHICGGGVPFRLDRRVRYLRAGGRQFHEGIRRHSRIAGMYADRAHSLGCSAGLVGFESEFGM